MAHRWLLARLASWPGLVLTISDGQNPATVAVVNHYLLSEGQTLINPSPGLRKLTKSPCFMNKGQRHDHHIKVQYWMY